MDGKYQINEFNRTRAKLSRERITMVVMRGSLLIGGIIWAILK